MSATAVIQSEWMSHIEGRPIPDGEHAHCLNTIRGPVVFFINRLNRHLVVLKPDRKGGQEVLDLSVLWKLTGQIRCLATTQSADGGLHLFFAKGSTQEGLTGKLFGMIPILPHNFDDEEKWQSSLRVYTPLSLLSGVVTVQSITPSLAKHDGSIAIAILKFDDAWKAVKLEFQDTAEGTNAGDKQEGVETADRMQETQKDDKPETTENQTSLRPPLLLGTDIAFAKHADLETIPRLIPGRFADKPGLFYYFSSKGTIKFGFRQDDGVSTWFDPPGDTVNSIQVVSAGSQEGGIFVGTSKSLLLYSAPLLVSDVDKNKSESLMLKKDLGGEQISVKATSESAYTKGVVESDSIADVRKEDKNDEVKGGVTDTNKLAKIKPIILYDGPVSHLLLASMPDGSKTTVWMLYGGSSSILGYFDYSDMVVTITGTQELKLVPVVEKTVSTFSCSLSVDGFSETVLYHTTNGVNLLERSLTGLWSEQSFEIPTPTIVKMAPAYVSHIKLTSTDYAALRGSQFLLTCTSSVTVLVNEAILLVDQNPQVIGVDSQGKIEIVNVTEELQTPNFILQNAPGTSILEQPLALDPAYCVKERLQKKTSPEELKELNVGKDGKKVFPEVTDFDKLSDVLKAMYKEMDDLPADGTRKANMEPLTGNTTNSWSLFHIAESTIGSIQDFAVEGGHLVITVAGKIIGFMIDCFETALKAVSTILTAAGALTEDLQHWLGYVFDWEDIVTTHESLTTVFNFALSTPDRVIEHAYGAIDGALSSLVEKVLVKFNVDEDMQQVRGDPESLRNAAKVEGPDKDHAPPTVSHPAIDYILNKLPNSMLGSKMNIDLDLESNTTSSMRKFLDGNGDLLAHISSLAQGIINGQHISLLQLFEVTGEAALAVLINALRGILASFKQVIRNMLRALQDVMKKPRDFPLLSALYKFATGSVEDPSFLQLTAMVIAIPVAITCKILSGTNFPVFTKDNLPGLLTAATASGTSAEASDPACNPLESLYKSAVPHLGIWMKEQPKTLGWIDLIYSTIETASLVFPDITDFGLQGLQPQKPGVVAVNNVTIVKTIVQGFAILASIPMIPQDKWESTAAPELRFEAWGMDAGLRLLEVITLWQADGDQAAASYNKSLVLVRNTLSAIMWSKIAVAERKRRLPDMTEEDFAKAQKMAMWTITETLTLCASHIAPVVVIKGMPENICAVVALTTFALSVAGNASRWARSEYDRDSGRAFSVGPI